MNWWQRTLALVAIMIGLIWGFYKFMEHQAELRTQEAVFQEFAIEFDSRQEIEAKGILRRDDGVYYLESTKQGPRLLLVSGGIRLMDFADHLVKVTGKVDGSRIVVRKIEILH